MRFVSLFSGMGGFDLGLEMAGMECVLQAENDKDCLRVLEKHWPDVRRVNDVRSVSGDTFGRCNTSARRRSERADGADGQRDDGYAKPRIDLIVGGFPCQDVSVAGKRAGLDGARSGLWFEFHRIVSELRPKYVLVENVPGLLSSNEGRDFAVIIDGLGELGYGVSWTVLDSRFFGVAQRRRRVFIVAGPPDGRTEAILAIAEGCGGHPAAGGAAGEDVAGTLGGGSAGSSRGWRDDLDHSTYIPELSPSLTQRDYKSQREDIAEPAFVVRTAQTSSNGWGVNEEGLAYTLDGADGQAVAMSLKAGGRETGPHGALDGENLISHTLRADGFDASEDGTGRGTPLVAAFHENRSASVTEQGGTAALRAGASHSYQFANVASSVRRLTPTECLRLQNFPDDWLDLDPPLSDGAKYRMCGNAVTVSVIQWIGERMMAVETP